MCAPRPFLAKGQSGHATHGCADHCMQNVYAQVVEDVYGGIGDVFHGKHRKSQAI